jgi:hypothetical protein
MYIIPKQFRRISGGYCSPGEVFAGKLMLNEKSPRATAEDGTALRFKIVKKVHPNTVYAVLRRAGFSELRLDKGRWYEVHGD